MVTQLTLFTINDALCFTGADRRPAMVTVIDVTNLLPSALE